MGGELMEVAQFRNKGALTSSDGEIATAAALLSTGHKYFSSTQ